nr:Cache 3/Cache 2 fusion domain-containing protein [uncultured Desulfuromonas sp.]
MKIRTKIAFMALILVVLTAISIVSVLFYQLEYVQEEIHEELISKELEQTKNALLNTLLMVNALQDEVEQRLHYDLNAAFALLESSGGVILTPSIKQWSAVNQYNQDVRRIELPQMNFPLSEQRSEKHWKSPSTEHFIEHLSTVLGVTCTLFQRMNPAGDMLRISTTVPSSEGRAAVGTYIPAIHDDGTFDPVITEVLQGNIFIGRAYVVNDWYNTAYRPLYDNDNNVIGMLYVGEKQSDLFTLIHSIEHISTGEAGSIFMIEANNRPGLRRQSLVKDLHNKNEHVNHATHRKDIEAAHRLISTLSDQGLLELNENITVLNYQDNLDSTLPELKNSIIVYCYFAPWDWIIGIYKHHDHAMTTQQRLDAMFQRTTLWVSVAGGLWFVFALWLAFRLATQISQPLEVAISAFRRVGDGDLEYHLSSKSSLETTHEIKDLYQSFDQMIKSLKQVTASRDELDHEVSARRQIEQELQQTVSALETIIEEAPMAIIVVDEHGHVILWNPTAEKMLGWKAHEVLGQIYPLVKGEKMTEECLGYKQLVEGGLILHAQEIQRYHKNGHTLDLLVSAAAMEHFAGRESTIVILLEDISTLKKAQRQLQEREEQYKLLSAEFQSILESIEDVISLVSRDMKILWCNHGQKRWNNQNSVLPLVPCYSLVGKEKKDCLDCAILESFETGESRSSVMTTPNGIRWGVKTFPQKDDEGNVVNVIEVASDITESSIIREEALRSARLASLGELSAGIAHEINNPNGVIMQNAPILHEMIESLIPVLDDYAQQHGDFTVGRMPYSRVRSAMVQLTKRIQDSSQRIKGIVDDLKDFVRDEGRQDTSNRGDINYALEAAIRLTNNTVKKATNFFTVNYGENLPSFAGSVQRIEQVIVNLIMNACQSLPDTDAAITVSTRHNAQLGQIELEIVDEGCGISAENVEKVTNPFFTTKRETGGTGLGMSISSRIIEEHQGHLSIVSTLGSGTSITISLPCFEEKK